MKRPGQPRRGPMKPGKKRLTRSGPIKKRGGHRFKDYVPNPAYQLWVRSQGCIVRGVKGHECSGFIEFMHVRSKARGGCDEGNGLPGCSGTHQFDKIAWHRGEKTWQRHYEIDAPAIAAGLYAIYTGEQNG